MKTIKYFPLLMLSAIAVTSCGGSSNELAGRKYKYDSSVFTYVGIDKQEFYEKNGFFDSEQAIANKISKVMISSDTDAEHKTPDGLLTFDSNRGADNIKLNGKDANMWTVNHQELSETRAATLCYYSKDEGDWHLYGLLSNEDTGSLEYSKFKVFEVNHIGLSVWYQARATESSMKFEDNKMVCSFDVKILDKSEKGVENTLYSCSVTTVWYKA